MGAGSALCAVAVVLSFTVPVWEVSAACILTALVLNASVYYLPDVELLRDGGKTRWARSSRYIVTLLVSNVVAIVVRLLTR